MFLVLTHWYFTGNSMFYPVGPGVISEAYCGLSPFLCMWFLVSGIFIDVDYAGVTTLSCWCSFFLPRTSSFPFSFSSSGSYGRGGVLVGGLWLGRFAPTPSYACENLQAHSFKLNPLNSLSCRKMTIQRLKNLRLMTQRYLVLALVGGWFMAQFICLIMICPTNPMQPCVNFLGWNQFIK